MVLSDGNLYRAAELYLGDATNGAGTLSVTSGTLSMSFGVTLGSGTNATGTLNLSGNAGARGVLEASYIRRGVGDGALNFDGGVLRAMESSTNFIQGFDAGDISLLGGGLFFDTNAHEVTIGSAFSGTGGLTKQGVGTLTLSGSSSFTGTTSVLEGTLAVADSGALGAATTEWKVLVSGTSSTLQVNEGATINRRMRIEEGGTLRNAGVISGQLRIYSSTGMNVINTGTIASTLNYNIFETEARSTFLNDGGFVHAADYGLVDYSGGGDFINRNGGRLLAEDHFGANVYGGMDNTFVNTGSSSIRGTNGATFGPGLLENSGGSEIVGTDFDGLTVTYYGVITSSTVRNMEGSLISGVVNGVSVANETFAAHSTVINTGSSRIFTTNTSEALAGIYMIEGTGIVMNSGSSSIYGRRYGVIVDNDDPWGNGSLITNTEGGTIHSGTFSNSIAGVMLNGYSGTIQNGAGSSIVGQRFGVRMTAGGTLTNSGVISGSMVASATNAGVSISGSAATVTNSGTINGGVILGNYANAVTLNIGSLINGNLAVGTSTSARLILGGTSGSQVYSGAVTGTTAFSGTLVKQGAGTWIVDRTFSSTRGVSITGGVLQVGNGGTTGLIAGNVANAGTLAFNRSDALTYTGTVSGTGGLQQMGSGTLILSTRQTYTGTTTVAAGTLRVSGTLASSPVVVRSGAALTGGGLISGAVTVDDGGILQPGNAAGTLTVGSLLLKSTSDLRFELGTTSDLVVVTGNLTLDGILSATNLAGFGTGTYTLFQYGGTLTNNGLGFGLLPAGFAYALDLSTAGYVRLTVSPSDLYWDGPNTSHGGGASGGDGTWNNSTTNWTNADGTVNYPWSSQATAHFTGSAGMVNVGETISVSDMAVETDGYAFSGTGKLAIDGDTLAVATGSNVTTLIATEITGTGGLVKSGTAGRVILTGSNSYTGGTTIATGTLQLGNGGDTGSIGGDVQNDGTLVFNRSDAFIFAGNISGSGDLLVNQDGILTLTGSNSYSGGTRLERGALLAGHDSALGSGAVQIDGGTTFGAVSGASVTLQNGIVLGGDVDISLGGGARLTLAGTFDLGASTRTLSFTHDGGVLDLAGSVIGNGGLNLITSGSGIAAQAVMSGTSSNVYAGRTTIGDGIELRLEKEAGATALAGDVFVDSLGRLTIVGESDQIAVDAEVALEGVLAINSSSGTFAQTLGSLEGFGQVINSGSAAVLTVGAGDFAGTLRDGGAGALALVKSGAGTLRLSGANAYRGGTTIAAGRLETDALAALGQGAVTLTGGTLAPVGQLDIASLDWTGGTVASVLGSTTSFLNIAGNLTLTGDGFFEFSTGGGFLANTEYAILRADNLGAFQDGDFLGTAISGLTPTFTLDGDTLYVSFNGSSTGPVLQNSGPYFTPVNADFVVNGAVATGSPAQDNTVNSLLFAPGGSLEVFNTLTVTSGNFIVPVGSGTLQGGTIRTPGAFTKLGAGLLDLFSEVFAGASANVQAGTLLVNGLFSTQSGLSVSPGAVLGGAGVIVGDVSNNGIVAPGNSPGTLTILGDYTQGASGVLEIEIATLSNFDRLVVSGQAVLSGILDVENYGGNTLAYGEKYAILQAGGISGDFDEILMPEPDLLRGRFVVAGGTGILVVAPASYTLVAETTNQRNVAKALDSFIPARGDDREAVSSALDFLAGEQYPAAFDQIAPSFYESLANITIEQAFAQTQQINQRLSAVRLGARGFQAIGIDSALVHDKDGKSVAEAKDLKSNVEAIEDARWNAWVMGNGLFGKVTNVSQVPNYRFNSGGFLVGVDYSWNENFVTGLFGGYQYTYADYNNAGNTQINSALFGGYATYDAGGFYADAVVGGGYNGYRARRGIEFSTVDRTARSQPNGGQFSAALNLGYDWEVGKFTFGPIAGAQYTYAGIAPFTETGAESLDLRVAQQNTNSLRTTFGGRVAYTWSITETIALIPEVRMFWQHEFLNNPRNIGSSLDGGSGPAFGYETSAPARDSVFAGAGVNAQFGQRWNAFFFYNVDFGRQDYMGHMVSGGVNWKF